MDNEHLNTIIAAHDGTWATTIGDVDFVIKKLMFHVAVLTNPTTCGWGHDHRYCYASEDAAKFAIEEFKETGELKYWKKDHTNNISIKDGYAYAAGNLQIPEYSEYKAEWDERDIAKKFPFASSFETTMKKFSNS